MIKLIALGRLGSDARLITDNVTKPFVSFSLASDNGKDKDGNPIAADWIHCTYNVSEDSKLIEHLKKGVNVYIEGRPAIKMYQNEDGKENPTQVVYVNFLTLAGK